MTTLSLHAVPHAAGEQPAPAGWPFLRLGFRPFYLGAALFAVLAIPLWVAVILGHVTVRLALPPLLWHAHEMLFGFAIAVIVGFLLTAVKAWTGLETPRGAPLGALALLWAAARIAAVVAPYVVYALLDVALLPLVAAALINVLVRAGNRRNLPLAGILILLSVANAAFHLAVIGSIPMAPLAALRAGLALIVVIECVITGRVVPAFTKSANPGLKLAAHPRVERATLLTTVLALALWVFAPAATVWASAGGACSALAAALHLFRQWHWQPQHSRTRPILWILHAAYVWIAVGLGLLAMAQFGQISESAGVHALAVGVTGGLIIGMITRTARGHTGRPLVASKAEVVAYGLVMFAAAVRVLGPLVMPQCLPHFLACAAFAWCSAFCIYLAVYAPWLLKTRLDGKDG